MLNLIPQVKTLELRDGALTKKAIFLNEFTADERLGKALRKLPSAPEGAPLTLEAGNEGEGYELWIEENAIRIKGEGPAGAFYAVQTLRQIFRHEEIPCLYIKDCPDFPYRGFYHDVTRGRVPTVASIKELIDQMAYYKLNSLQLYVEHTFPFEETKDLIQKTGALTEEEIHEIDAYCKENFIEFIPSLSTFGHLFELLNQEKYAHLRVMKDYEAKPNRWADRMGHHTIDPLEPQSIEVIKSLIDQYLPHFESDIFNICCDETFDLTRRYEESEHDPSKLYVEFVKKIIAHLKGKGKQVMMWADILLKHPETITEIPDDIYFLNWFYRLDPPEDTIIRFSKLGRKQIVCPGTTIWNRFCEGISVEEENISLMAEYGYKHGAMGVLNTNWGDYGHTCSLELSMYGLVLGAEKSWTVATKVGEDFSKKVDFLLYQQEGALDLLKEVSAMQDLLDYRKFCVNYYRIAFPGEKEARPITEAPVEEFQRRYLALKEKLSAQTWAKDEYRQELLLAIEAVCIVAELHAIHFDKQTVNRVTDTEKWLKDYRAKWLTMNKESELYRIEEFFRGWENL